MKKLAPDVEQTVYVATAEDTVLAKLRWYDSGGRVSTTQWNDVIGIIGGSSSKLDLDYLHDWARKLHVTELLDQAFKEVGDGDSSISK